MDDDDQSLLHSFIHLYSKDEFKKYLINHY